MGDIKEYQELTFKAIEKLIKVECNLGHSKLYIDKNKVSNSMVKYLEDKGLTVYINGDMGNKLGYISW
jgi:hypothetical protein